MEDIYGDLENYQFDDVSQLKNENQQLKFQLAEYASSMAGLQKDFDKLSADYKKLESNYSSLLKTARAEIERKSLLITNLNIEKDKLVIDALQNRGRNQNRKNVRQQKEKHLAVVRDLAKNDNDTPDPGVIDKNFSAVLPHEKKDNHDKTSLRRSSPMGDTNMKGKEQKSTNNDPNEFKRRNTIEIKENKSIHLNKIGVTNPEKATISPDLNFKDNPEVQDNSSSRKYDVHKNKDKDRNEIKKSKQNHPDASTVSKVRDRRKSMPLMNRGDFQFSSDEDQDDELKDQRFRRKTPLRDDRSHYDRYRDHERNMPEPVRMGDKYTTNYDPSRDIYRNSNNRYESDRYKTRDNWDKYEPSQRTRKYYSPDRQFSIQGENYSKYRYSNERPHRFDNVRHRQLVSPPPERNNKPRGSREFDGHRFQHEIVHPLKHKLHDVLEEPVSKRPRSESINHTLDRQTFTYDRDIESHANSMSKQPTELSYLSLQSPDYAYMDNYNPVHQIKEIKCTSDIKLDDPRMKSKKYKVNTSNDKVVLSTIVGRDVDVKVIDTSRWNKNIDDQKVDEMPALLRDRPSITENLVKDIYMNIDNPVSNLSLESGEICLEDEIGDKIAKKGILKVYAIPGSNDKSVPSHNQIAINKTAPQTTADNESQSSPVLFSKSDRISKINKSSKPEIFEEDGTNRSRNKVKKDTTKQAHRKKHNKDKKDNKSKKDLEKKMQVNSDDCNPIVFSHTNDVCKDKEQKVLNIKHTDHSPPNYMISAKDTVEGDLELSDDTCDYIDVSEQPKYDKGEAELSENCKDTVIQSTNSKLNMQDPKKLDSTSVKHHPDISCEKKHFNIIQECHVVHSKETSEISKEMKCDKDNKTKRAEINKDIIMNAMYMANIGDPEKSERTAFEHAIDKNCKNKKNYMREGNKVQLTESTSKVQETKPKDTKNKLCDLFGDTSSLITLDDLGIMAPITTKENLNDYAPIFENTQDAIDLNVEDMKKVRMRSMKPQCDEEPITKEVNDKVTLENVKVNNDEIITNTEIKKSNNDVKNKKFFQPTFENVNIEPDDNTVVKTVIISEGIQNNCNSGTSRDIEQVKEQTTIQKTTNDNATSSRPALLSIKALATSTPCKLQSESLVSLPVMSCSSTNITPRDAGNNCKAVTSNLDIPDVRIIVKRRRKGKPAS